MLGQPSESWDCHKQSKMYCHPIDNKQIGENLHGYRMPLYQEIKFCLLFDVVQMDKSKDNTNWTNSCEVQS